MTEQMDAAAQDRQQQDVQQEHRKYVTDLGDWRRTQHCGNVYAFYRCIQQRLLL